MCRRFEEALAFHCGPALAGIKAANLVSLSRRDHPRCRELAEEYGALLSPRKIHLECLCGCGERVLLLEHRLRGADGDGRRLLEGRIRLLRAMGREARELAVLCERYYERGYCRNGKYTL